MKVTKYNLARYLHNGISLIRQNNGQSKLPAFAKEPKFIKDLYYEVIEKTLSGAVKDPGDIHDIWSKHQKQNNTKHGLAEIQYEDLSDCEKIKDIFCYFILKIIQGNNGDYL